jgi:hypothetical protein
VDVEMSDDDMNGTNNGAPNPGNNQVPPNAGLGVALRQVNPAANPAPTHGGNQPPPPPPDEPFSLPEEDVIVAEVPNARGDNPYLKPLPAQPAPQINQELGRAPFQRSAGQFPGHIITNTSALGGIAKPQLEGYMKKQGHKFFLVVANGGNHVLNDVRFETPLEDQATTVLRTLFPDGKLVVTKAIPDPDSFNGGGKYGGPKSMLALVKDDASAAAIQAQTTYSIHDASRSGHTTLTPTSLFNDGW